MRDGYLNAQRRRMLETLERKLAQLPTLPSIITRIALMDPDAPGFTTQIEMLVHEDPPLAARLLSRASINTTKISTLSTALARVGARQTAELITSMSVQRVFVPTTTGQRNLWIHALQVAVAARIFAQRAPELGIDPQEAYLAGLLHDIGRFVMFDRNPAELGRVDEVGWKAPAQLIEAELEICGYDHAELGWHACKAWKLPERVSHLIRDHHVYEGEQSAKWPPEMLHLVRLVQAADVTSIALLTEPGLRARSSEEQEALIKPHWNQLVFNMPPVSPDTLARIDIESHGLALGLELVVP